MPGQNFSFRTEAEWDEKVQAGLAAAEAGDFATLRHCISG